MIPFPPVVAPPLLAELLPHSPRARLLDVRTPAEFAGDHIAGSYNLPLDALGEHAGEISANLSGPVVLVCRSGQRARKAEFALREAGMANLHVLEGGIANWREHRLPLVEGPKRISLERQVRMAAGTLVAFGSALALVAPAFVLLPLAVGIGLVVAGATDTCVTGKLLARLPYNRTPAPDVSALVRALTAGAA